MESTSQQESAVAQGHRLGEWGEDLAARFLLARGYAALDRRYRRPGGEIDLVMRDGTSVVFVEVKTRGSWSPAAPEFWVDRRKLRRLRLVARCWLAENAQIEAESYRFDVVAIRRDGHAGGVELRHLVAVG